MSLRGRLLLAVGAVALVALLVADVATYSSLRSFLYHQVDQSLESAHFGIEAAVTRGQLPGEARVPLAPGTFAQVRDAAGDVLATTPPLYRRDGQVVTPSVPRTISGLQAPSTGPGEPARYLTVASVEHTGDRFRMRISALGEGAFLILAEPLGPTTNTLHHLLLIELAVTASALAAAALLGWWLVRVGLRPLADVERTAEAIADGELGQRVPGESERTEVGRLAQTLNTMLGRIEDAFAARDATEAELRRSEDQMRRFVADASHELRTPLAAVSAYAELFERGARDRPEDLARVMSGIRSETRRMSQLVDDLLLLARLDEGRPLERNAVELVALAAEAVETATAVGPAWPARLRAGAPVEVIGDRTRLRQVLDNLLSNVRAHTPPGTSTEVRIGVDGAVAVIAVADDGPGLPPEQMTRVFERFYRADASRSREHGGTGLGLGIVAAIVAAHGGDVSASATPGGGVTFTVRLPLVAAPVDDRPEIEPAPQPQPT